VNVAEAAILVGINAAPIRRAVKSGELEAVQQDPLTLDLAEVIQWRVRTASRRPHVEKAVL